MVSLDQYEKDKEEFSNHLEEQLRTMESSVQCMWSNNTTLNLKKTWTNLKTLLKMKTMKEPF